jgi:hypothetical protein
MLWLRGGFPDSLLARDERCSLDWRRNFIRSYLERDVPMFAPRLPAETIGRLWTMLAHQQGSLLNQSRLAPGGGEDVYGIRAIALAPGFSRISHQPVVANYDTSIILPHRGLS